MSLTIDLNADLGEECGDDLAMLDLVTSASIAAGAHAGGGQVLEDTVRRAAERGVRIGAHVSYPDRATFGRESWRGRDLSGLADVLLDQIVAVADVAHAAGARVSHVKAHGALYNDAWIDPDVAEVLALALVRFRGWDHPGSTDVLGIFAPGTSVMARRCSEVPGVQVVPEAFADRAYRRDGSLAPRSQSGAVLTDAAVISHRAVTLVRDARVRTDDGAIIPVTARTLCIHGDTPDAVGHARALVAALAAAGIGIAAWSP